MRTLTATAIVVVVLLGAAVDAWLRAGDRKAARWAEETGGTP